MEMNSASAYFNENWQRYQRALQNNTLNHREMIAALVEFLDKNLGAEPIDFVDVGCGDATMIASVLMHRPIKKYIGIDAAPAVLEMAAHTLAPLHCAKEFLPENMTTAIPSLSAPVDIIFTSYAVHHLSLTEKNQFLADCQQKLKPNGFLLMIDGVLAKSQTREEWLDALAHRMLTTIPELTEEELPNRMQHSRTADFPESLEAFAKIAQQQGWRSFEVIVDKEIFAFMVFRV